MKSDQKVIVSATPGATLPYTISCRACGRWSDCTLETALAAACPSCGACDAAEPGDKPHALLFDGDTLYFCAHSAAQVREQLALRPHLAARRPPAAGPACGCECWCEQSRALHEWWEGLEAEPALSLV